MLLAYSMLSQILAPFLMFLSVAASNSALFSMDRPLAVKEFSLENRYADSFVNKVFKDNILLDIAYMSGKITKSKDINWDEIEKPFKYKFTLDTGKTFAFHEDVLPQYQDSLTITTKAHFNRSEGFKSDGYLVGDGVCHLASLIYWAAKDAGLDTYAPANHDFMQIPEIPKEFGVAIYSMPGQSQSNARQNLYITNNRKDRIAFEFDYDGKNLKLSVEK